MERYHLETGRDFDLPRHSHYSGVIPMVFQHSGGRDFDLTRHSHYSGVIPMVFQHKWGGTGEILTFPDTLTTQLSGVIPMVFQHSDYSSRPAVYHVDQPLSRATMCAATCVMPHVVHPCDSHRRPLSIPKSCAFPTVPNLGSSTRQSLIWDHSKVVCMVVCFPDSP